MKGHKHGLQGIDQSFLSNQISDNESNVKQNDYPNKEYIDNQDILLDSMEGTIDSFDNEDDTVLKPKIEKNNFQLKTNNQLDQQIEEMIEKNEGQWKCKMCGKISTRKEHIKRHAETHIAGVSHDCQICSKLFSNRITLQAHIYNIHGELLSCAICEKSGMNRRLYNKHTLKHPN